MFNLARKYRDAINLSVGEPDFNTPPPPIRVPSLRWLLLQLYVDRKIKYVRLLRNAERRKLIIDEINRMPGITCLKPKGAFYVFPNIRKLGMSSTDVAMHLLEKARVITVPGTAFGECGEGYIRISYVTSREKIAEAASRIGKSLQVII